MIELFKFLDNNDGIKDFGNLHKYLGIQVEQDERSITIHQEQYAEKIFERFGFGSESNSPQVPMEATAKYTCNPMPKDENESEKLA